LARRKFFFNRAPIGADTLSIQFGWRLATGPDIGHSDKDMAPFAMAALFSTNQTNHEPTPFP
jgi:hypothetical protein